MSYWQDRERENIKQEQMKDEEIVKEIRRIINVALREAEKEIQSFYARYAVKNKLTPAEAKKRVSEMDVQAFQDTAARYVKEKNFSDKANRELSTYNTKMYINRQELLMMYLNAHLVAMANDIETTFQEYLEQAGIEEVARQAGILGADMVISTETLLSLVGASFHSATWSSRIWDDMEKLRDELDTIMNSTIIRGVHPDRFVPDIRERFDVTTFEARRLLITETARVQAGAQKLSYEALTKDDPEAEYEFIAMMDGRTTKTCRSLNGKKFKVKNMMPGINAEPMHPFCRSSTVLLAGAWREAFFAERKGKYTL
ncbi:minor capsid protein [Oceanobacillus timonensis]|uniref:minor capsid protein n=1 Tax=Oceanobacillus timonensis TaxID=1926285 RepID=UPI0009BA2644|nr:minor capsid protein [Oceanobacillus timonensis]